MNKISFLDELMKLGAVKQLIKRADVAADVPHGMVDTSPVQEALPSNPADAATRLPDSAHLPSAVKPGTLGEVTQASSPIDQFRFNFAYGEKRR